MTSSNVSFCPHNGTNQKDYQFKLIQNKRKVANSLIWEAGTSESWAFRNLLTNSSTLLRPLYTAITVTLQVHFMSHCADLMLSLLRHVRLSDGCREKTYSMKAVTAINSSVCSALKMQQSPKKHLKKHAFYFIEKFLFHCHISECIRSYSNWLFVDVGHSSSAPTFFSSVANL